VLIVLGNSLVGCGRMIDSTRAAAERYMAIPGHKATVHSHAILIDMAAPSAAHAHMHYRGVIGEDSAPPHAAGKADAAISEAVVYAAIVANVRSPVAFMEHKQTAGPAPVSGSPKRTNVWRRHPRPGNPVVAFVAVGPVARRPHQSRLGANGLYINRQHRGSKPDTDEYSRERGRGNEEDKQSQ
jgi:hypothetical protein